jgi:hypothetical protein
MRALLDLRKRTNFDIDLSFRPAIRVCMEAVCRKVEFSKIIADEEANIFPRKKKFCNVLVKVFNRYDVGSENFCRGNVIKKSTKAQGIDFVHDSTVLGVSCWEGAKTFSLALKRFERSKRGGVEGGSEEF